MSLELRQITKKFGSLLANDQINLKVEKGEIHAILGENGAGKSTLMNIVYGLLKADSGEILVDGQRLKLISRPMHSNLESVWFTNTSCSSLFSPWPRTWCSARPRRACRSPSPRSAPASSPWSASRTSGCAV